MKHILIVDDNPQNLYLLESLLNGNGYRVSTAANGTQALQTAGNDCPDLVVSDILMPVMDGFELCRQWKANDRFLKIPFIFYTATYTDPKDEEFALNLGAERFVIKPQDPAELLRIMEDVLVRHPADVRADPGPKPLEESVYIKGYNEALIRKLEDKMLQLEKANKLLEQDIEERKRMEGDLKRLATAIEQAAEIVMITDPRGNIQYLNPVFEKVTGFSRQEAIGQNPRILKSGRQNAEFYRNMWQTISSGDTWTGRIVNKRKDGKLFTETMTISPVRDAAGEIVNYVGVKRDITEYLKLEEQFQQAMKMEAVGRLAGGIAHDINNALTPLMVTSDLLLRSLSSDDALYEDIGIMQESGRRCVNLTRQLLTFSRNLPTEMVDLNLNDVVRDMIKMLSRVIGEDIKLVKSLDPELSRVKGDVGQMEQVIANLVLNSRDAMPDGGEIIIETKNVLLDETFVSGHADVAVGPYVMLAISDTGCGMDAETQSHVFEPFFSTKERGKGTGLGLPTVYGIVKNGGGSIWVYSEPGKGTTVKIFLPQAEAAAATAPVTQAVGSGPERGKETVLLVEDEDAVRRVASRILGELGYTIIEANSAEQAIEMCKVHPGPVHLIITDVVMPGMNGKELTDRLALVYPGLKCLYMSGYIDNVIIHHGLCEGGANFIQKPFSFDAFSMKVRQVLDQKGLAAL